MKLIFKPKTRLGKWSVIFSAVFIAFFLFSGTLTALTQQQIGKEVIMNPAARPFFIVFGLSTMASGLLTFFTGIVSLVKYKERSVLVYLSTFIGFLAVVFLIGEFAVPH